jgi:ABC-type Mn2+/Zn2+ transport system permease subunit
MGNFLLSLVAGIFIEGMAGYLESLMVSRRMAMVAGPLGGLLTAALVAIPASAARNLSRTEVPLAS